MAAFYNTATLSYRDTSTNSNTVEGQLVQVLAAEKTAVLLRELKHVCRTV